MTISQNLPKDYEIIGDLGKGTFGIVVQARHVASKTDVAIKCLRNCFQDAYSARKIISEI